MAKSLFSLSIAAAVALLALGILFQPTDPAPLYQMHGSSQFLSR